MLWSHILPGFLYGLSCTQNKGLLCLLSEIDLGRRRVVDVLEGRSSPGMGNTLNWLFYSKIGGGGCY